MRHLAAIFYGLLITTFILFLVAGPQAPLILVILVVCTGGLGLIPLLLVSWLVGLAAMTFFHVVIGWGLGLDEPAPKNDPLYSLVRYVRKAQRQGTPESEMEGVMAEAGWGRDEIAEARWRVAGHGG